MSFERAVDPARTAEAWFAVSAQFDFGRLHDALTANESEDRWERAAMRELDTELNDAHSGLCCQLLDSGAGIASRDALANLHNARVQSFTAVDQLMRELRSVPAPSLAALQVTVRALTRLARGS